MWGESCAGLFESGRVTFLGHSFFTAQPHAIDVPGVGAISSPSVYLIRGCTHNWPDEDVLRSVLPSS